MQLIANYPSAVPLRDLVRTIYDRLLERGICPGGSSWHAKNYREGQGLWHRYRSAAGDGSGDTEDLRQAMTRFRALFDELLEGERVEEEVR